MVTFASISLKMSPGNTDSLGPTFDLNINLTADNNRLVVLCNLVSHRQIGVKVVLTVKFTEWLRGRIESEGSAASQMDRFTVEHRQGTGQAETNVANQRVGWSFAGVIT